MTLLAFPFTVAEFAGLCTLSLSLLIPVALMLAAQRQ